MRIAWQAARPSSRFLRRAASRRLRPASSRGAAVGAPQRCSAEVGIARGLPLRRLCLCAGPRAYIAPLYKHAERTSSDLPLRVRCALEWWQQYLHARPKRAVKIKWERRQRVLVYSDATGKGELCYVIVGPDGTREWAAARAPRSLKRFLLGRKTQACW